MARNQAALTKHIKTKNKKTVIVERGSDICVEKKADYTLLLWIMSVENEKMKTENIKDEFIFKEKIMEKKTL